MQWSYLAVQQSLGLLWLTSDAGFLLLRLRAFAGLLGQT